MKLAKFAEQRSPTLKTVMMVEETLRKAESVTSVAEFRRKLPKQVMHQTLVAILEYLRSSGKIILHEGKVLWTFNDRDPAAGSMKAPRQCDSSL